MRVLALDTATENCSVALHADGQLLQQSRELDRGHAEHILVMIDELLAEARLAVRSLDAIAFGRGPGAFTGVRLAASVTQGLAFGASLGVVPISDLRAVAQRALDALPSVSRVLVCSDARMRELYWGCFERQREDALAGHLGAEHVGTPADVMLPAEWLASHNVLGVGTGFTAYPALRATLAGDLIPLEALGAAFSSHLLPRAPEILKLALPEVRAGRLLPPESALPTYLRDDVARAT